MTAKAQKESRQQLTLTALHESGGHGTLVAVFCKLMRSRRLRRKPFVEQRLALIGRLSGIVTYSQELSAPMAQCAID